MKASSYWIRFWLFSILVFKYYQMMQISVTPLGYQDFMDTKYNLTWCKWNDINESEDYKSNVSHNILLCCVFRQLTHYFSFIYGLTVWAVNKFMTATLKTILYERVLISSDKMLLLSYSNILFQSLLWFIAVQ